jgi:hypothetical protein
MMLAIFNMLIEKYKNTRVESEFLALDFLISIICVYLVLLLL